MSLLVGYLSSVLGIGGGILHVPVLIHILNFPVHIATATSPFVLAVTTLVGTGVHVYSGMFSQGMGETLPLAVGVLFGAPVGAEDFLPRSECLGYAGTGGGPCSGGYPHGNGSILKKVKKKILYLSAALFLILSRISVYGEEKPDVKTFFETKCGTCHSFDRPKKKQKTADEWTSTVMRMKNVNGCPITDDEPKLIIDNLTKNYGLSS